MPQMSPPCKKLCLDKKWANKPSCPRDRKESSCSHYLAAEKTFKCPSFCDEANSCCPLAKCPQHEKQESCKSSQVTTQAACCWKNLSEEEKCKYKNDAQNAKYMYKSKNRTLNKVLKALKCSFSSPTEIDAIKLAAVSNQLQKWKEEVLDIADCL